MTDTDYALNAKLKRAMYHLNAVSRSVKRYLEGSAVRIENDFDLEPSQLIVRSRIRRQPPLSLGVSIGEFLYHQRAALDYMACELVRHNGQQVNRHVEFPIFMDADNFRNPVTKQLTPALVNRIGLMRADHQKVLEEEQPFQGKYGKTEDDPLAMLYGLSNYDRHQFLHVASALPNESIFKFTPEAAEKRFELANVNHGIFTNDGEIARFHILDGDTVDAYVDSSVRFDLVFGQDGPEAGRQVLKTLAGISIRVAEVVLRLNNYA
ncbi:MAG TPA: hypothetical protein VJB57_07780 [Dehalococcoidia bacterium]|nr:hypothetical protein [Dehalococcoidia bacterium]